MKFRSAICDCQESLDGKTVIITGCNSGIGKATINDLYRRGAKVIMACRNLFQMHQTTRLIKQKYENATDVGTIDNTVVDLASMESIKSFAEKILKTEKRIDILINNAAVMCPIDRKTADKYDLQFGVNHLGHFLLTNLLLPRIIETENSRIINVTCNLGNWGSLDMDDLNYEKRKFSAIGAYMQSKLCNVLFSEALSQKLKDANIESVRVFCVHPGYTSTNLIRNWDYVYFFGLSLFFGFLFSYLFKTAEQGAQTIIHCAVVKTETEENNIFYSECAPTKNFYSYQDKEAPEKLWNVSAEMCQLENYNPFLDKSI